MKMNKRQFQDSLWYIIIRPDFTSKFNLRPPNVPNLKLVGLSKKETGLFV